MSAPGGSNAHTTPFARDRHAQRSRIVAGGAGIAAALLLALSPLAAEPSYTLQAPAEASKAAAPATAADDTQLRDQSRRNSRIAGKAAQLFASARRAAAAGDIAGALSEYDQLVVDAPSFAPARSNRGNILVSQHRYADAVADYSKSLELSPLGADSWVVFLNRGSTYLALGDVQHALDDVNAALAIGNGDTGVIYANRAACYESLGKWDIALRDYQRAVEKNANDVQPWWIRYALVLFERDRSQESLAILRRVGARFEAADVHAAMAALHFSRGEIGEAETQWSLVDRPKLFLNKEFLERERKWPPKVVEALEEFGYGRSPSQNL
jgi:tetratricopeptide (TPR) repeat protein